MAEVVKTVTINDLIHPFYSMESMDWAKWRLAYKGGREFIDTYLKHFSTVEDSGDFATRKEITYNPAFAKAALIEVRNSIYQRLDDISRSGGSKVYQEAVQGKINGVDLCGSSMNTFMGIEVLEELITMRRVGVYIDMPPKSGETIAENINVRPYLYIYKTEDIRSWVEDDSPDSNLFKALLLRDRIIIKDEDTGLPLGEEDRYRYFWRDKNGEVFVKFYNHKGRQVDIFGGSTEEITKLDISRIPFVPLELNASLMEDIADYQIALLNLASSDMAHAVGANFSFYTEQFDPRAEQMYAKTGPVETVDDQGGVKLDETVPPAPSQEIRVGAQTGRRYPKGVDRPGFVHPSSEPMRASMEKQEQLKLEIRLLINLSIANIQPKMASADSKGMDERTLESGLSYIGLLLEDAERQIADIWHEYEGSHELPTIKYPTKYSLRSEKDIGDEVDRLKKMMSATPSQTYKKVLAKRIAELVIGNKVRSEDLKQIYDEIDKAKVVEILVEKIEKDVVNGILDPELAAELRGYPVETVKKAQDFRIQRIKEVQLAQTKGAGFGAAGNNGEDDGENKLKRPGARGVPELATDKAGDVREEKEEAGNPVRGKENKIVE